MPQKIGRFAIAALASVALVVTAAPALGGGKHDQKVKVASTITMPPNSPAFHGRVKSSKDACIKQRTVKMFEKRGNGGKDRLGTDLTNKKGKWQVIVDPLTPGDYFAVVTKETQGKYVCERAKSLVAHIVPQ